MKTTTRANPDWKRLYELLADLASEQSLDGRFNSHFNRPLGLRHSLGVGVRDETTGARRARRSNRPSPRAGSSSMRIQREGRQSTMDV